jgi:uncharacterized protein (DUF362 family)
MVAKVAIVGFEKDSSESLRQAIKLIGGIDDLNTSKRSVVIKVGVFDTRSENRTTVDVAQAITKSFDKAPKIFLAESDSYRGTGMERLQIWKELFSGRIIPFNLSVDEETRAVTVAGTKMKLSHVLFKPNVLVSTHVVRGYEAGSILKNLFGLVPDRKKAKFHKVLDKLIPDLYEVIGGIDVAVLDGTYFYKDTGGLAFVGKDNTKYRVKMNTLIVGRDAVAVETVGALLVGLKPEKMPILREAVRRGLGEGNLDKIEVVGISFETTREKFASATKSLKSKKK